MLCDSALYRTITYMEDSVMERHLAAHTGDRDKVTALFVRTAHTAQHVHFY